MEAGRYGNPTSTVVDCTPASVMVGVAASCTATVSTAAAAGTDPAGTVTFSTDSAGSFESGGVCMLASAGNAGVTACSVHYIASSVGTGTHTVTAHYTGDGSHDASNGTTHLTVSSTGTGGTRAAEVAGKSGAAVASSSQDSAWSATRRR